MSRAYIMAGKLGDVCSVLPILQHEHQRTGEPQKLVIASQYAPMLSRAKFAEPVVYGGDFADLSGAIRMAKQRFDEVIVPQVYGKDFPVQHRRPSFQLDQWDRAGCLNEWDALPLTLERPANAAALVNTHLGTGRFILFADHGQSSPFPHAEELALLLQQEFGATHKIVRLSSVHLDNPMDMLALYDAAELLITIETFHLHLSAASKINVIALVTDSPSRWHGSAWSKRFKLYVRYSDFQSRKGEVLGVARKIIDGTGVVEVTPFWTQFSNGYNPSLIEHNGATLTTYRYHPDDSSWRTELALHDGVKTFKIVPPEQYAKHSIEDARLFRFGGKLCVSAVVSRSPLPKQTFSPCVTGYGELAFDGEQWSIRNWIEPQYGKNAFDGQEKNWVFFEHAGKLHCIYSCSPQHIVLELEGARVVKEYKTPCPTSDYGTPRGGTQPFIYNGQWLRFVHGNSRNPKSDVWWTYYLLALTMEPFPPFRITAISKEPILAGDEQYFLNHKHWKPKVVIVYGAIDRSGGWLVSVGVNDSACRTAFIKPTHLNL